MSPSRTSSPFGKAFTDIFYVRIKNTYLVPDKPPLVEEE
jgi:hypothetical protein